MKTLVNLVGVELGWVACVLGAARGNYWIGPMTVAVLLGLYLLFSEERRQAATVILAFGAVGFLVDSVQAAGGVILFEGSFLPGVAPLWIIALWFHFSIVLLGPLQFLTQRPLLASLLAAIGAPLSYVAGARLGAAALPLGPGPAVLFQALTWAAILPTALILIRSYMRPDNNTQPPGGRGRLDPALVPVTTSRKRR
jgi:hypothetical protein